MPYSTYLPEHMGSIRLTPAGPFVAGSFAELTLVYTAGTFGIDDTGMVKVSWRTTSDMAKPQFDKPQAANFTTVEASNGAKLEVWYDRLNIRPYVNTLLIRVGRGYLRAGDTLTIRFGDKRQGSPGWRLQTNVEKNVELKTSIDAFATYEFCELPEQPAFDLIPGPAKTWKAIVPSLAVTGQPFRLAIVAEDMWGNPTTDAEQNLALTASQPLRGLPPSVAIKRGEGPRVIENLVAEREGDVELRVMVAQGVDARQSAARGEGRNAEALLGRPARPERRNRRHGIGGRLLPLRARSGVCRHDRPPGQRLPDHRCVLEKAQRTDRGVRQARTVRLPSRLRMVRQHRNGRRPQRVLPPRGTADPPLVAYPGRRPDLDRRHLHRRQTVRGAERRGRHRDRPCRRALRRREIRPRRKAGARGRGAFLLGHVRMDPARRLRKGLPGRRGLPQRRPQGTAGRHAARCIELRCDRRAHLLLHAGTDAGCFVCGAAPTASLRHHRQPAVPRPARQLRAPTWFVSPTIRCSVPSPNRRRARSGWEISSGRARCRCGSMPR